MEGGRRLVAPAFPAVADVEGVEPAVAAGRRRARRREAPGWSGRRRASVAFQISSVGGLRAAAATPPRRSLVASSVTQLVSGCIKTTINPSTIDLREIPDSQPELGGGPDVIGLPVERILLRRALDVGAAAEIGRVAIQQRRRPDLAALLLDDLELDAIDGDRVGPDQQRLRFPDELRDSSRTGRRDRPRGCRP